MTIATFRDNQGGNVLPLWYVVSVENTFGLFSRYRPTKATLESRSGQARRLYKGVLESRGVWSNDRGSSIRQRKTPVRIRHA